MPMKLNFNWIFSVSSDENYPWVSQADKNIIGKVTGNLKHQRKGEKRKPDRSKSKGAGWKGNLISGTASPRAVTWALLWSNVDALPHQ